MNSFHKPQESESDMSRWRAANVAALLHCGVPSQIANSDRAWGYLMRLGSVHGTGWDTSWITSIQATALLELLSSSGIDEAGYDLFEQLRLRASSPDSAPTLDWSIASDSRLYTVNEVIASLTDLQGQTVRIECVLHLEFEGDCIRHIPAAERRAGYESDLWADFDYKSLGYLDDGLKRFNGRHVIVTATVDHTMRGHFSLSPGSVLIRSIVKREK